MTEPELDFKPSRGFSMGVELELQILNSRDYNLARDAADLLALLEKMPHSGEVKPEITESMIELNSSVHHRHETLAAELAHIRDTLAEAAGRLNLRIAGGGSHPFHAWTDRRIYPTERFRRILEVYGYLAKQFTIFGQHVHIGVPDGDAALYLIHALSRYVPHFIALSASSPFQQGEDTSYQSSRLNTVSAFPLSGHAPFVQTWPEFIGYFRKMKGFGIIESMKDLYWDIRPKPEYGTVEVRVFDTPLTVERAALLAAYAQALARYLLLERPLTPLRDVYLLYSHNRFQACRYGLDGTLVDAYTQRHVGIRDDVLDMLKVIAPHAHELGATAALGRLTEDIAERPDDAAWLRQQYKSRGSLNDVARMQSELWMGSALATA
ncbi:MAG TPA: YbdK family carboxylate-amine ligase [Burkholderiales bacterium]|jgi:carboxylate-amine ligase|nr:YbdK family carboxylate-amine ligase [Burkholderiales bacterium]